MSATNKESLPIPTVKKAVETNPQIDAKQVQEAQQLIIELRKAGVRRRGYALESPYVRQPLRKQHVSETNRPGSAGFGTPHG